MPQTPAPTQPMGLMDFVQSAKASITEIPPQTLLDKLKAKEDVLVIDVRESAEYQAGHINGAHLVPRGILEAAADPTYPHHFPELATARDRQVIVYCATSGRSAMAAAVLQMMGFKHVASMEGGFSRWVTEGMPEAHEAAY